MNRGYETCCRTKMFFGNKIALPQPWFQNLWILFWYCKIILNWKKVSFFLDISNSNTNKQINRLDELKKYMEANFI